MTQEKQKVIRVLKPTQKKKNLSPIYYGIAGVTFGIAVTSVLIFSVLGDDSKNSQTIAQDQNTSVSNEQLADERAESQTSTKANAVVAATDNSKESLDHSTDDYEEPQTKLKDIPNAIKQEKQAIVAQNNQNPFANAAGQKEVTKPPVIASEKIIVKKPIVAANTAKVKPVTEKAAPQKAEAKIQAKPEAIAAKTKAVENENDVDLPKATVQISVTRSVKE